MSGAAVEPGLLAAAEAFRQETGSNIKITFATAPEIRRRVGAGEMPDVVIAPPAVLDELAKSGKADGTTRVLVGRVGVGVVVRDGAPKPDISTTDALKRAVLDAEFSYLQSRLKRALRRRIDAAAGTERTHPGEDKTVFRHGHGCAAHSWQRQGDRLYAGGRNIALLRQGLAARRSAAGGEFSTIRAMLRSGCQKRKLHWRSSTFLKLRWQKTYLLRQVSNNHATFWRSLVGGAV